MREARWRAEPWARMATVLIGAVVLMALAAAFGCGGARPQTEREMHVAGGGSYRLLTPRELAELLEDESPYLLNVSVPAAREISGTHAHIAHNALAAHRELLPEDPEAMIVVYCRTGVKSADAARRLVRLGYTRVYDLEGGIVAWQRAGLPVDAR